MYFNTGILRLQKIYRYTFFGGNIKKLTTSTGTLPSAFPILPDTLGKDDVKLTNIKEKSEKLLYYHEKIRNVCLGGGGEKGRTLHVAKNKKVLPRERIECVFDEGSDTLELCLQTGLGLEYGDIPGGGAVCIIGKVHGQYCVISANDGTLKGGTFFPVTVKKCIRAQEVSSMNHLPIIFLVDSGGGFLPMQADLFPDKLHGGRAFYTQAVDGSRGIPQLALVCGSCTAGGAYVPMMCDDAGIVHRIGMIYLGGPPLVKAATGEIISSEDLGGATLHCKTSGCTDYFASTEKEGFDMLRDVVATLDIYPPPHEAHQQCDPQYNLGDLDDIVGIDSINKCRLKGIIARLVDGSQLREFKQDYGQNLITGYAFIDRLRVGIVANSGPLTVEDGLKGSHFVQICDQRNIPIIFLQNSGPSEEYWAFMDQMSSGERADLLRGRTAMITAVSCANVPKVSINIGGCHGDDNFAMCGPSFSPNFIFCWPGTEITLHSPIKPSAPVEQPPSLKEDAPKKSEKKTMKPPTAFPFPAQSSWFLASRTVVDGIIMPSETRKVLLQCVRIFEQKRRTNCKQKDSPVFRF